MYINVYKITNTHLQPYRPVPEDPPPPDVFPVIGPIFLRLNNYLTIC